jgi:glucose/arabinose dehydrogenase
MTRTRSPRSLALPAAAIVALAACSASGSASGEPSAGSSILVSSSPAGGAGDVPSGAQPTGAEPGGSVSTTAIPSGTEPSSGSSGSAVPGEGDPTPVPSTDAAASLTGAQRPSGDPVDVVTGLAAPWSVVFVDSVTALVSERDTAIVRELTPGGAREVAVLDGVQPGGEGGLLGLALYPVGAPTHLYTYFTTTGDNRIVRYPLTGGAGSYGLGPAEEVFRGIIKNSTHNGGRIAFGPDGMLYVTTGDAQQRATSQDPDSLNGKILRLTPEGAVPADNPIPGNPMYSMGHRNPQGIAWDASGQLWATEFGQNTWDELNRIEPGANYGWPTVEGIAGTPGFVDPVQQWPTDEASPSGIAIVGDTLFIANLRGERLRSVDLNDPAASNEHYTDEYGRLRDAVVAPDGTLWVLTNNTDGRGDPRDGDDRILGIPLEPA